jgi:hypothetical protein
MTRIDVSMVYTHLMWGFVMTIYLNTVLFGLYSIWTDLREDGGQKESWIMFGLVLTWIVLALTIYQITESV